MNEQTVQLESRDTAQDGDIIFTLAKGEEVLRFKADGRIFVRGNEATTDLETVEGFRAWLRGAAVEHKGRELLVGESPTGGVSFSAGRGRVGADGNPANGGSVTLINGREVKLTYYNNTPGEVDETWRLDRLRHTLDALKQAACGKLRLPLRLHDFKGELTAWWPDTDAYVKGYTALETIWVKINECKSVSHRIGREGVVVGEEADWPYVEE